MTERWWPVVGFDGYEVSELGSVRRSKPGRRTYAGRLMTPVKLKIGYLVVAPTLDGKNSHRYVHDLVTRAFLGEKPHGFDVNHIDGDKTNNSVANLEYVSHRENMRHAARNGLIQPPRVTTEETDLAMRNRRLEGFSYSKLAAEFGVSTTTVWKVINGRPSRCTS